MKFKPTENFSAQYNGSVVTIYTIYLVHSVHIHALNKLRWDARRLTEVNKNKHSHAGPGLHLVSGIRFAFGQSCFPKFFFH